MIRCRYADGRTAVLQDAVCELGPQGVAFNVGAAAMEWSYADHRRADDNNGQLILKRRPDTGEPLILDAEYAPALRIAAPRLFGNAAFGVESPVVVASLAGAAASLAAVFLFGVPMLAGPIADIMPGRYRDQISDISWSQVNAFTDYCDNSDEASRILNDVAHRMMTAANVANRDDIWITIVAAPFPNAFALSDNSIIVTDQLIELTQTPDELVGVLAHEIAHVEGDHVLKNIIGNIGAGIFFDVVFGGAGVGQAIAIASVNLAGLRYSRGYEEEADARGLDYLDAAHINTGGLAILFDRLRNEVEGEASNLPTILSTHPATTRRAERARGRAREGLAPSIAPADWAIVRNACAAAPLPSPDSAILPPGPTEPAPEAAKPGRSDGN